MKLTLFLFLSLFSIIISQSQTFNDGILEYTVTDATNNFVSVKKYNNNCPTSNLVIPENVTDNSITYTITSIADFGFSNCSSLTNVLLPNGINRIGSAAFRNSTALITINFPSSLTYIDAEAFSGCSSLTNLTFPSGLTNLQSKAFKDCTSLTQIMLPDSITYLGLQVFMGCTDLTTVNLSNGLSSINGSVFYGCTSLINVTIPDNITTIGTYGFYGCINLTDIILPPNLDIIADVAFFGCTSLSSINFPETLTSIGVQSFFNTNLNSISIPSSVTTIKSEAFKSCDNLTNVSVNWNNPLAIDADVFDNVPINTIPLTVPAGTIPDYQAAPVWQDFESFNELSISDFELAESISLYPNPTSDILRIELNQISALKKVLIYNHLGQIVSEEDTTKIDVSNYSKGMYFAQIETTLGKSVKKFIVK